jgi:hypothetical protein
MNNEHDDDLASTVDTRDEVETDDYPKTGEDLEDSAEDENPENSDDDYVVGK